MVVTKLCNGFCNFPFLNFMVCSLQHGLWVIFYGLDLELSSYEVVLALYEREVGPKPEKVCHFFEHVVLKGSKNIINN